MEFQKNEDTIITICILKLKDLCVKADIDDSHGVKHALAVLNHVDNALKVSKYSITSSRKIAIRLAALLHDADDRKYFPETCHNYVNAIRIMTDCNANLYGDNIISDVIKMIQLVSCSVNGNSYPEEAYNSPELLWPRWADRLEATGIIGIIRCYQYTMKIGMCLYTKDTPKPKTSIEVLSFATLERFENYQKTGGQSISMIDHYYDKLLHISKPDANIVNNSYLEQQALERVEPLISVCLAFTNNIDIKSLMEELMLQY